MKGNIIKEWSNDDDKKLLRAISMHSDANWIEIQNYFNNRSP